ncbi:GEVED domain-containing protein [Flavobacterium xinjiangense]|uniref:Por secretion system C-terminal sorting domain-containing protein n=1 Tax=Flavobacterium xinjiangense TaxID=178356 RepID=A0A1M7DEL3_9FLAO|nr:GEVED domain-containing protein [Flavobacterium xinjiangense]SHL77961.1 hypothetical protein SAMN05216269_10193 [Flavobacterium xinjiangense]
MEEHYLVNNTDSPNRTVNLDINSSSNIVKKKHYKTQSIISFLSLLLMFFFTGKISAQTTSTYTASGNWVCPQGVTSVTVEAWGGGGKGGDSSGGSGASSGGGGGAYAKKNSIAVTPGSTYTVNVGLGGNYLSTASGGDSYFNNATTVKAAGGSAPGVNAVSGALGGLVASSIGDIIYRGGNGGNSPSSNSGAGGGGAGTTGNGGDANLTTAGTGTTSGGGNGGSGVTSGNGAYNAAIIGGGGGGAKGNGYAGGDGARGEIRITFTCPSETANAGSDQPLGCGVTTTTLTGNAPSSAGLIGTWTLASGTATITTPSSPTSGVTGLASSGTATLRWTINNGLCGTTTDDVIITTKSTSAITTNPSNSTIAAGANTSFSTTASNSPTSYIWELSTDGGTIWSTVSNGGVYTNATTATLNITNASIGMNNYRYRAKVTNSCGTSAASTSATLTVTLSYCTSSGSTSANGITGVDFNTISNTGTAVNVAYSNYTAISTTLTKGNSYNLNVNINTGGNFTNYQSAWIDWNGNGSFTDPGEFYNLGTAKNVTNGLSSLTPYPITVPLGAATASVRMRIQSKYDSSTTGSCSTGFDGEVEDYTINIISNPAVCTTPTSQPTALTLSPNGTSISGFFTAASSNPSNYLIVVSTSAVAPTPSNGTVYTIGGTVGAGYTVVDTDDNTTFLANGLTPNTAYYIYIYSFNGVCTGGPLYNSSSPLNGTTTTLNNIYCTPSSVFSSTYISGITSIGTLNDISNAPTGFSPNGYGNYTAITIAKQIPGGGINININLAGAAGQFVRAYVDWNNDGDFIDALEQVYSTATTATGDTSFGFVVAGTQASGNYRMRIRTKSYNEDSTIDPCTTNFLTGETEDYTINIQADCLQKITSWTDGEACGPTSTVNLSAVSAGATGFRWYTAETGGILLATTATGNWTTAPISVTTTFYVTAYNGTCESLYRVPVIATIKSTSSIALTPSVPTVCGENNIVEVIAKGDVVIENLLLQNFESGIAGFTITTPTNTSGGADTPWSIKTSPYLPSTTSVWKPAINSSSPATTNNKFAFTTSDYSGSNIETRLTTPIINASVYTDLTLNFDHYYSYYSADSGSIEVSTDGGTTWITPAIATYNSDLGSASKFKNETVNFSAYAGQSNLRFRFTYKGTWDDGWAIDNIRLYGTKPLNTTFSWSGGTVDAYLDLACSTAYTNQAVTTIYIKPTSTQLSATSWSFTASATLSNGCPVSKLVTIYNKTKQWLGTTSNWDDANNWKPVGVPDLTNCVFIPNTSVIPGGNYNALAKNLTVKSTGNLELLSTSNLTVSEWVNVNTSGVFNIRDKASLIQINNVANTGSVNIQRTTRALSKLDYTYWSSPVAGFTLGGFSSFNSYMYSWIPTVSGNSGNWNPENDSSIMSTGKGYILRTPWGHTDGTTYTTTFIGTPNNGDITTSISKGNLSGTASTSTFDGTDENDEWNLIGNPYPSALDAAKFLNLASNVPAIGGTVYLWTHNSQPNAATIDPFYGDYALNYTDTDYAVFNTTGGTATAPASTGGSTPTGYIASGQSFFVKAANTMANGTTATTTFNNSMRVGVEGKNSDFFKLTKNNKDEAIPKSVTDIERHRIWINLTNNSGAFSQTLVGYVQDATQGLDRSFDGESLGGNDVSFYSIIPEAELTIQGRALPFDENDLVPLGYNSEITGELSIRIDHIDGLFNTQNIYLEDKELSVIHNLKQKPYVFKTEKGDFNDRFVLRYSDKTLGTNTFNLSNSDLVNVIVNQDVTVQSSSQLIKNIVVYDLSGRKIDSYKKVNALKYTLSHLNKTTAGLIVKITLDDDTLVSKKIIY